MENVAKKAIQEARQKDYEKQYQLAVKRDEFKIGFLKQLLLTASSLLGLLVALHKTQLADLVVKLVYSASLGLLALGILCLSVALYSQVDLYTRLYNMFHASIQRYRGHTPEMGEIEQEEASVKPKKIYAYVEKTGYFSLMLSVICLTVYAILSA